MKERLVIPLNHEDFELIKAAARSSGLKHTTFARRLLVRRSQALLDKEALKLPPRQLSATDSAKFLEAIENSTASNSVPNAAFQQAIQRGRSSSTPASQASAGK